MKIYLFIIRGWLFDVIFSNRIHPKEQIHELNTVIVLKGLPFHKTNEQFDSIIRLIIIKLVITKRFN